MANQFPDTLRQRKDRKDDGPRPGQSWPPGTTSDDSDSTLATDQSVPSAEKIKLLCSSLNRINFGQHKSDNNNPMIQLTDAFCVLRRYNGIGKI